MVSARSRSSLRPSVLRFPGGAVSNDIGTQGPAAKSPSARARGAVSTHRSPNSARPTPAADSGSVSSALQIQMRIARRQSSAPRWDSAVGAKSSGLTCTIVTRKEHATDASPRRLGVAVRWSAAPTGAAAPTNPTPRSPSRVAKHAATSHSGSETGPCETKRTANGRQRGVSARHGVQPRSARLGQAGLRERALCGSQS